MAETSPGAHTHIFLGAGHEKNERRTWMVIALCSVMMVAEIVGGLLFGSIALVADGLHMSTHASALLLAALAYRYARRHVHDERFSFGTGKLGDLAGFTSAIVLAMIAILIGYEAVMRLFAPVAIHFREAIPIAVLGLIVNIASVLLLGGDDDQHGHDHSHGRRHDRRHADGHDGHDHAQQHEHQHDHEHAHHLAHRDNNMRAAVVHVLADAAVSALVIAGLTIAMFLRWNWIDPVVGLIGALVIAVWAYTLIRDTGAILLDMNPDRTMTERMRAVIETDGDRLTDFHVWRLGPGHLAAILSVETCQPRGPDYYQSRLRRFRSLSHV
ncbi:MAG TPA: CDF family Co(II)/Ni(II) efflux transporter DmeF, partial [Xanthobacteraceae bacterium]|nr:CDF family Co(II)/Ni(II) efflux transporter DmeF [Xanthobacteraceae bacterium]